MQKNGTTRWEAMTQELKEIREEIFDDNMTNMKDIANITGGLKNRMEDLEKECSGPAQGTRQVDEDRLLRQTHSQRQLNLSSCISLYFV